MTARLYIFSVLLLQIFVVSCGKVDLPEDDEGTGGQQSSLSADLPKISVAEAQNKEEGSRVVVTGYIVGYINGNSLSGAVFEVPQEGENTNILLADDPAEENVAKVFPVRLEKSSNARAALNLFSYPENLHRRISIEGTIGVYFKVAGLTKVFGFVWEGETPAPDPGGEGGGTDPDPDPGGEPDPSNPTPGISDTPTYIDEGR